MKNAPGILQPSIPYINADFIAQQLKTQHASLMLAELARQFGSEEIKKYIAAGENRNLESKILRYKHFKLPD